MATATVSAAAPALATLANVLEHFHYIPAHRVHLRPAPGTATERDVIAALDAPDKRLYELIDGTLVEKTMGIRESLLAVVLIRYLAQYVEEQDRGIVLGADGTLRVLPHQVRIPDV